jgi:hypothetical protein
MLGGADVAGSAAAFAPNLRLNLAYTQIEDQIATSNTGLIPRSVRRGDDFAVIVSPEITPFKGLDIKPLYSYIYIQDSTSASTRRPIANAQGAIGVTGNENRHTIGVDARWRSGPFSLDPTFYYQFGNTTNREAAGTLFGFRATYSLTPQLAFYGIVSPTWTDEKVNIVRATAGATSRTAPAATGARGDSRYIGTEADLGMTWRFAPNTVFDLVGAWLFAGSALDVTDASGKRDSQDGWTVAARVRMSF